MWKLEPSDEYDRRHKRYVKNHPRELQAVLDNLDTYFKSLEAGVKPLQISHGFMHHEPLGVVAIDQKGGGKSLAQTRLYVYPDTETETLHVITLGDKGSQKDDIATCRTFVQELRKEGQDPHEDQETDEDEKTDPAP
jgi:hypothetical protein